MQGKRCAAILAFMALLAIAEKKGAAKRVESPSKPLEPQIGGAQQETRTGKCQG